MPRIAVLRYVLVENLEIITSSYAGKYIGSTPQHYDEFLGPLIFVDYAADIAQRVAAGNPARVLETAAGTGIRDAEAARPSACSSAPDGDRP